MTTQPHEERKAIAHAAIDGAEIQCRSSVGDWISTQLSDGVALFMHSELIYRIKPERKPNAVNVKYCEVKLDGVVGPTSSIEYKGDTHKMTIETDPNETPPKVVNITLEPLE